MVNIMKFLLFLFATWLTLDNAFTVPINHQENTELLELIDEEVTDDNENEENTEESGSGSGSKRDNIEDEEESTENIETDNEHSIMKNSIAKLPTKSTGEIRDSGNEEYENQLEKSRFDSEIIKKTEVPLSESQEDNQSYQTDNSISTPVESDSINDLQDVSVDKSTTEQASLDNNAAETEEQDNSNDPGPPIDDGSKKRSSLTKRWGDHEGEQEHGHHHGHNEHEHEHHHHGHHHGFIHEWGEEEGGGHHGHEGHGHHEHDHHHEHEHEHDFGGHENIGHHGGHHGGCGDGGYDGGCYGGGGGGGGGYGWGRSSLPAPPIAFHCRDMVSHNGKKYTKRFCVPIGYNGGYGWPYFHGYPGVGLGKWGWGFPWIKSKIGKNKNTKSKKELRDHISKKQTVHVGYGYASGDNYRLGYQARGMGGLASTFTGQLGPNEVEEHSKKSTINKRHFGGLEGANQNGYASSSTPYGHPVTHPGFTTMGYPGHALASTDVRSKVAARPKRSSYDSDSNLLIYQEKDDTQNLLQSYE